MPAYRNKIWDGQIKLYNIYKQTLYAGLIQYVQQFAYDRKYTITVPKETIGGQITIPHMRKFMDDYLQPCASGKKIKAHEHQVIASAHAINNDRCLLLSPTGSGKSLIIYTLIRYYLDKIDKDKKVLIIVPTTSLVSQMYSDFKDYSSEIDWDVEKNCHTIFAGREKQTDKRVVISTWQSIYKLPEKYFDQYSCVIGDECHLFKSKSLTTLMTKLVKCPYRVGTTGTLDGSMTHKLVIEGLFGRVFNVTSTKNLMDKDLLSALKIQSILLKYPSEIRQEMKKAKYQDEIDWIVRNEKRNDFIKNMALNLKGNTLVLFQFVEKHGKYLHSIVEDAAEKNRPVFFIYGGTDVEMREKVRHITEKESNAIIVASYGTFSTGISIRKLHNIIFASPSKSRIRVLQSIGRQLRKSEHKDIAKLYDIGDDLSWKSYKNHTLKHFEERVKIYKSENFDYDIVSINI